MCARVSSAESVLGQTWEKRIEGKKLAADVTAFVAKLRDRTFIDNWLKDFQRFSFEPREEYIFRIVDVPGKVGCPVVHAPLDSGT